MDAGEECGSGEGDNVSLGPDGEMEFQGRGHWDDVGPVIDDVEIWNDAQVALSLLRFHLLGSQVLGEDSGNACLDGGDRHFDVVEIKVLARLQGDLFGIPLAEPGSGDRQAVGVAGIEAVEREMPVGIGR